MHATLLTKFAQLEDGVNSLPKPTADNAALHTILNIVFAISGSVALLIVVIGGFRYVVSHGDPNGVAQAKKAILYALIGLVVILAAFSIVNFVVLRVT